MQTRLQKQKTKQSKLELHVQAQGLIAAALLGPRQRNVVGAGGSDGRQRHFHGHLDASGQGRARQAV